MNDIGLLLAQSQHILSQEHDNVFMNSLPNHDNLDKAIANLQSLVEDPNISADKKDKYYLLLLIAFAMKQDYKQVEACLQKKDAFLSLEDKTTENVIIIFATPWLVNDYHTVFEKDTLPYKVWSQYLLFLQNPSQSAAKAVRAKLNDWMVQVINTEPHFGRINASFARAIFGVQLMEWQQKTGHPLV